MSKESKSGNHCRRCGREISDPNAAYGWWCAQIVGLNAYNNPASGLDGDELLLYNAYKEYLSKNDANNSINNVETVAYNDNIYIWLRNQPEF